MCCTPRLAKYHNEIVAAVVVVVVVVVIVASSVVIRIVVRVSLNAKCYKLSKLRPVARIKL